MIWGVDVLDCYEWKLNTLRYSQCINLIPTSNKTYFTLWNMKYADRQTDRHCRLLPFTLI
jgi:hypothetical protein